MSDTTVRPIDGNGHTPGEPETVYTVTDNARAICVAMIAAGDFDPSTVHGPPARCPYPRSRSKLTCEWSISLDYAGLTELMDHVFDLWDMLNLDATDERIGDGFEGLVTHISELRQWTGWAGVPGIYTGGMDV